MKKILLLTLISAGAYAQTSVGSITSGSLAAANYSHGVGEIYVVPQNPNRTAGGITAIASQVVFGTLGTGDYIISGDVKYYPNPTKDFIIVELPEATDLSKAALYDAKGMKAQFTISSNRIDIASLSSGIYFLTFPNTKIKPIKIVKN
jgi:hypothetical protein